MQTEAPQKINGNPQQPIAVSLLTGERYESQETVAPTVRKNVSNTALSPESIAKNVQELFVFPQAGIRILELLDDPDTHLSDFAEVLCQDVSMSSAVLRLANSGAFYSGNTSNDVQSAIARIGTNNLRALILSLSLPNACVEFTNPIIELHDFWDCSLKSATIASCLAKHAGNVNPSEAFTAGLMLDLGQLLLFQHYPESSNHALETCLLDDELNIYEAERLVFGFDHQAMGKALAEQWNFPRILSECISLHHATPAIDAAKPLIEIVQLTVYIYRHMELDEQLDTLDNTINSVFHGRIEFNEEELPELLEESQTLYNELRDSLQSQPRVTSP